MSVQLSYAVSYDIPGAFFPEAASGPADNDRIPQRSQWPRGAYAARLIKCKTTVADGETFKKSEPVGPRHLAVAEGPYTADEVLARYPDRHILASNARQWKRGVVLCPPGNWQPVQDDDVLVLG